MQMAAVIPMPEKKFQTVAREIDILRRHTKTLEYQLYRLADFVWASRMLQDLETVQAFSAAMQETMAEAITALVTGNDEEDANVGILLLADLFRMLTESHQDEMASAPVVKWLETLEERPWATYGKQDKPITQRQGAWLLKLFGIRSAKIRINAAVTAQGYRCKDCADSFARYLAELPLRSGTAEQTRKQRVTRVEVYTWTEADLPKLLEVLR